MEQLLLYLVFGILGYFVGVFRTVQYFVKNKKLDLDTIINENKSEELDETVFQTYTLEIEKIGDTLYLYDKDTSEFICQGKSVHELMVLAKKFKNIQYALAFTKDTVYTFYDGTLKEAKNEGQFI
jgi:hypothetical protein